MTNETYDYRLPRLFVDGDLAQSITLPLQEDSAHYLKNVLRRTDGAKLRVFNGRQGEFLARFNAADRKKQTLTIEIVIRAQPEKTTETHLVFAPIKKDRQDFMIEKAVELSVTHFHPVLTQQTAIRDLNTARLKKQIIEAAEQCERLTIPEFAPLLKLEEFLRVWPRNLLLYAALERANAEFFSPSAMPSGLLIGPEGGFSEEEKALLLKHEKIKPVSFGAQILRSETASLLGLSLMLGRRSGRIEERP